MGPGLSSIMNTLAGLDSRTLAEAAAEEERRRLAAQTAAAAGQAQQAGAAYQQAAGAPAPDSGLAEFFPALLANIASVISENPAYGEQGQQRATRSRAESLRVRADNLQALHDIWGKKAEAAKEAGDLEAEEKARTRQERFGLLSAEVNRNAEHVLKTEEETAAQAGRIAVVREHGRQDRLTNLAKPPGVGPYGQFNAAGVAHGILNGTVPPASTGFSRGQWGLIVGEIGKLDPTYNITKSGLDYSGVLQHVKTLNQSQQVVLRQRAQNAATTAAYIEELIQDIEAKAPPRTPVSAINSMQLAAIKNGAWGPEAADAATRLGAQIAAWRLEMGSVYAGGYAPQEQHLKQGAHLIEDNWSLNRMRAGLQVGARDTNIRLQAVNEAGPVTPSNPLVPGGGPAGQIRIGPNVIPGNAPPTGTTKADALRAARTGDTATLRYIIGQNPALNNDPDLLKLVKRKR